MYVEVMYSQERGFYEPETPFPSWDEGEELETYLKKLGCTVDLTEHGELDGSYFKMHEAQDQPWICVFEIGYWNGLVGLVFAVDKGAVLSLRLELMSKLVVADQLQTLRLDIEALRGELRTGLSDISGIPLKVGGD